MRRPAKQRRPSRRLWPTVDYYEAMVPADLEGEHPVDILIERSVEVQRAQKHVRALEKNVRIARGSEAAFRNYVDARVSLCLAREGAAVNVGVEVGALVARAELRGRAHPASASMRDFEQQLRRLILTANLPPHLCLSALLTSAMGIARGPLPARAVADITASTAAGLTAARRRYRQPR